MQATCEAPAPEPCRALNVIEGNPDAIIMEVCLGGTLSQLIHGISGAFASVSVHARIRAALDVIGGIEYLHAHKVLHRDVKPANCLLRLPYEVGAPLVPSIKLADLGMARHHDERMTSRAGTLLYMAPEMIKGVRYSFPVDIYSFGLVLYEVLAGAKPFSEAQRHCSGGFAVLVTRGARPSLSLLPAGPTCGYICNIVCACWDAEPANRFQAGLLANCLRCLALMT